MIRMGPYGGGELIVRRTMTRGEDDKPIIHDLKIESADGARYSKPQQMLDALIGELTMDPLDFTRRKPEEQFEILKGFVADFNFDAHAKKITDTTTTRRDLNRDIKSLDAQIMAIQVASDVQIEPVDEEQIFRKIVDASRINAQISERAARRGQAQTELLALRQKARAQRAVADQLREQADAADADADAIVIEADKLETKISEAEPLPDILSVDALEAELAAAKKINGVAKEHERKRELVARRSAMESDSAALTRRIDTLELEQQLAIEKAKLPLRSLGFGAGFVTLGGVPFEQASSAEQLRASMALAMALNPTLRILRVRDGSLLDERALAIVAEMAKDCDFQIWLERVESSGSVGIVIEDGHVKGQDAAAILAAADESAKRPRAKRGALS